METSTQVLGSEEVAATPGGAAKLIREVRAKTRRQFSAEDRIRFTQIVSRENYMIVILF